MLLSMKPIEKSISQIGAVSGESMGRSSSKRKDSFMRRIGNEKHTLSRSRAINHQDIKELRRCCCEETNDELSMQLGRNPSIVSQLLTQIQDLQNRVNSLTDARDFYAIQRQRAALVTHSQPSVDFPKSQDHALLRCWIAA